MSDTIDHLLGIEEDLAKDGGGTLRDQLTSDFAAEATRIKRALDAGVTPAEFQALSKMAAAFEAAATVVTASWTRAHGVA